VVAVILGALVLCERITVLVVAGIALILAGVALTRNGPARHREVPRPDDPPQQHA
jgi:drug/metabolite transporter (DMT)-like permease